jgi:hypothetical protein
VSKTTVDARLELLALPPIVQDGIAAGTIPLGAVPVLAKIAGKAGHGVCEAFVEAVFAGRIADVEYDEDDSDPETGAAGVVVDWAEIIRDPGHFLQLACQFADAGPLSSVFLLRAWAMFQVSQLGITDEDVIRRAVAASDGYLNVNEEDVDAARAFGALLEFDQSRFVHYTFCIDPDWLRDRALVMLERAEARSDGRSRQEPAAPEDADAKKLKRAADKEARESAAHANSNLGALLTRDFKNAPLTIERAKLIALTLLESSYGAAFGNAMAWVLDSGEINVDVQKKDGSVATKRQRSGKAMQERLQQEIIDATKPGYVIGIVVQSILAMVLVDAEAAPASVRYALDPPWQLVQSADILHLVEGQVPEGTPERMTGALAEALQKLEAADA